MRPIERFMPVFHGVTLGWLFRLSMSYGWSGFAYNTAQLPLYWWIPDLVVILHLAAGAAVSFYFGFRKEEYAFWRKLLICAGVAVTVGLMGFAGRAVFSLPGFPQQAYWGLAGTTGLVYGAAFLLLSGITQGFVLLHFMTEKKFAG